MLEGARVATGVSNVYNLLWGWGLECRVIRNLMGHVLCICIGCRYPDTYYYIALKYNASLVRIPELLVRPIRLSRIERFVHDLLPVHTRYPIQLVSLLVVIEA
jgi:hypothetical protein